MCDCVTVYLGMVRLKQMVEEPILAKDRTVIYLTPCYIGTKHKG